MCRAGARFWVAIDRGICRSAPRWHTRMPICGTRTAPCAARTRLSCGIVPNAVVPWRCSTTSRSTTFCPHWLRCAATCMRTPNSPSRSGAPRASSPPRLRLLGLEVSRGSRRHRRRRHACATAAASGRSACAPTWTRYRSPSSRASRMPAGMPVCTTAAATTAIPRCCSARRSQLARTRRFDGTVHFIFQPAEEGRGGARVMVEQGLFERFPCDAVYALHNWPDLPLGHAQTRPGPDHGGGRPLRYRAARTRRPCRAAAPYARRAACREPARGAAEHHRVAPHRPGRIGGAVGHAHAGGSSHNVLPAEATVTGTVRSFDAQCKTESRPRCAMPPPASRSRMASTPKSPTTATTLRP